MTPIFSENGVGILVTEKQYLQWKPQIFRDTQKQWMYSQRRKDKAA